MGTGRQRVIGLVSVGMLVGGMMLLMPVGNEADAGGKKYVKKKVKQHVEQFFGNHGGHDNDSPPQDSGPTNTDLEALILMLKDQIDMVKDQIDALPSGGSGGGDGNHTLRWDTKLDSTNGDPNVGSNFGCDSDRFECIGEMFTPDFPAGEAVLDRQTGLVWDRAPHDTRGGTDAEAGNTKTWDSARHQCANRVMGGQKGLRLPSVHELASLVDPSNPGGNPDLPPGHPFIGVQSSSYWSATSNAVLPTSAWGVFFLDGLVFTIDRTFNNGFVWCVRGGGPLSEY